MKPNPKTRLKQVAGLLALSLAVLPINACLIIDDYDSSPLDRGKAQTRIDRFIDDLNRFPNRDLVLRYNMAYYFSYDDWGSGDFYYYDGDAWYEPSYWGTRSPEWIRQFDLEFPSIYRYSPGSSTSFGKSVSSYTYIGMTVNGLFYKKVGFSFVRRGSQYYIARLTINGTTVFP